MIICGMMGVRTENLPAALQVIAGLLPMSYISNDFIIIWEGGSYQFAPLIQSFLFLAAVSGIILFLSLRKNKRVVR
jgi:ABC-2 type transport system permease protein